jgi:hypothetical protein
VERLAIAGLQIVDELDEIRWRDGGHAGQVCRGCGSLLRAELSRVGDDSERSGQVRLTDFGVQPRAPIPLTARAVVPLWPGCKDGVSESEGWV